jgi:LacI family transcriptional regulator
VWLDLFMPTIYDVSKHAGVSTATVSRVINKHPKVDPQLRDRVLAAMQALRYVPNGSARSLVTKQTKRIALLISDITNPFFAQTARGAQDALDERGYQLLLANSDDQPSRELRYLSTFAETGVDGILIEPAMPQAQSATGQRAARRARAQQLERLNLPVVGLSSDLVAAHADTVTIDEEQTAFRVVDHLLGLGHRQIAMINGPEHSPVGSLRALGYRRALEHHRVMYRPELCIFAQFRREVGYEALGQLLMTSPEVSAVFAADELIGAGALQAARDAGRRVPQDLAVACVGDVTLTAETDPQLTVAAHPKGYEFGRIGSQMLLERILNPETMTLPPRKVILETQFIVRGSTVIGASHPSG